MRRGLAILVSCAIALWAWQAGAQTADLVISKSGTESAAAGDTIVYSIFDFNTGPDTAQNVTMIDPLPIGTTFVSLSLPPATAQRAHSRQGRSRPDAEQPEAE
jgi:uncharacterized repeat protein (TIGR01451 family)